MDPRRPHLTRHGKECDNLCSWKQTYETMTQLGYPCDPPASDATVMEKHYAQDALQKAKHRAWQDGIIRTCTRTYATVPRSKP